MSELSVELLDQMRSAAGYHQQPMRVTHEFYSELVRCEPPEPPFGRPAPTSALDRIPVGTEVVIVTDGSENVQRVNGVWAFVPGGGAS